ncbi:DUF2812 domain-containing protein [Bacillus sp. FJAT-22090]|uniref:DUF2812 domain-containing protein n=1 Tax=Bacillus sp. FJAT-22090 TaxID=1581038 RepID=UPI00119D91C0|nr:DUF2812 domain-containing protein [Bacillus sp. FJAT-22090]
MKKVKYRFYVDYEKEEQWVNEMAQQGWFLETFKFFRFAFVKGEPGTYVYRNEMLKGLSKNDETNYVEFLKESGIELVSKFGGWAYFRKEASDGPFEIYTDTASKISYYNRILNLFSLLFLFNLIMGIFNVIVSDSAPYQGKFNLITGIFGLAVSLLILIPIVKVYRRKKVLQQNRNLYD